MHKAFTTRVIRRLRDRVQEVAGQMLDEVQVQHEMDLIEAYAFPIPIRMVSKMLGLPAGDRERFRCWVWQWFFAGVGESERMAPGIEFSAV